MLERRSLLLQGLHQPKNRPRSTGRGPHNDEDESDNKLGKRNKQQRQKWWRLTLTFVLICCVLARSIFHLSNVKNNNAHVMASSSGSSSMNSHLRSNNANKEWLEHDIKEADTSFQGGVYNDRNKAPPVPWCINSVEELPILWRPTRSLLEQGSSVLQRPDTPWTPDEQALADEATQVGLDEIVALETKTMTDDEVHDMGVDAVNALIDETYATSDMPEYQKEAMEAAWKVLQINAGSMMDEADELGAAESKCSSRYESLKFVGYSQYLYNRMSEKPGLREFHQRLVRHTQTMIDACGTLRDLTEVPEHVYNTAHNRDHIDGLDQNDIDNVFDWTLEVIALTDAYTVRPRLTFPPGTDEFIAGYWKFVNQHHDALFPPARISDEVVDENHVTPEHYKNNHLREVAFAATHSAYVPTGYGRHEQFYGDAPWLYHYMRENLYYAIEFGMIDLLCEIVDLLRQYGAGNCDENNDIQLRDATRFILEKFKAAGHSWINHKEAWQQHGEEISNYDLVHKPWTAISGTIHRAFDPIVPGSYGDEWKKLMMRVDAKEIEKAKAL